MKKMIRITAHIFSNETCIEREDSPEIILCEERVCKISELRDMIRYFWRLNFGDYELTTINYCLDTEGEEQHD